MTLARALLAAALLCATVAMADGTVEHQTAVKLYRGIPIVAASDPNHRTYRPGFTMEACLVLKKELGDAEKLIRVSGQATYSCRFDDRDIITFHPAPVLTCGDRPGGDEQRQQTCPAGTVGTWLQDRVWTLQPAPTCWTQGDWTPTEPPAGMCAPIAPALTLKINAGGPAISDYVADAHYANGLTTNNCNRTWSGIFATRRYAVAPGTLRYRIPVANGQYTVRLLWRECWNSTTGKRVLSASVEGAQIAALDTYRPAGDVIIEERVVSVADGAIDVAVVSVTGDAMINGIDVVAGGAGPAPTPEPEPAAGTASLSWTPPTQNTDGSSLTDLAGYRISYGTTPDALAQVVQVANPGVSNYTIGNLSPGTYYFATRAYTSGGTESASSNVASKVVR
jgi:hypothetical protein